MTYRPAWRLAMYIKCLLAFVAVASVILYAEAFACSSHGTIGGPPVTLRADLSTVIWTATT